MRFVDDSPSMGAVDAPAVVLDAPTFAAVQDAMPFVRRERIYAAALGWFGGLPSWRVTENRAGLSMFFSFSIDRACVFECC